MLSAVAGDVTRLCEVEDFTGTIRDHRDWMAAMAAHAVARSGALHAEARVLTVGSGMEAVLSVLAGQVAHVSAAHWDEGDWARHTDGAFDAVICGPVEGVPDLPTVAAAAAAVAAKLRVGGVLSTSTRFRLHGPPGGIGWPGRALVLSGAELARHLVEPSGLELAGALPERVSDRTLAGRRDVVDRANGEDPVARSPAAPVAVSGGYVYTMAHLLLRKTKEFEMTGSVPPASTAAPSVRPPSPPPGGGGWAERVVRLQQGLAGLDDLVLRSAHQIDLLSEADFELGRAVAGLDEARRALDDRLSEAVERFRVPAGPTGGGPPLTAPTDEPGVASATVTLAEGLQFTVVVDERSADPITTTFLTGYCLFQDLVSLMLELVSTGDPVLDVGAHLGTFTLSAAAAGCPVLAIEASPANVRLLRASVAANGFHHAKVVSAAASDEPGSVQFCAIGPWGTVLNRPPSALSIEVPAITIDELVFELGFPAPRFVKMDVEGSEIRALRGMAHLLAGDDAPALLLESNGHTLGLMATTPAKLLREVEGFGYTAYMVDRRRLRPMSSADLQPRTEVDYLAVKRPPDDLVAWQLAPPLTARERAEMLAEDCRSESEDVRAYIGRAIGDAGPELLASPELRAALDRLAGDPVGTVRDAVSWWEGSPA